VTPWLTVIGVGAQDIDGLTENIRDQIHTADIVVGSERLLSGLSDIACQTVKWTSPLSDLISDIDSWRDRRVVVLATGDPMHYGIGATLAREFPEDDIRIIPSPSAFSLAAAKLGWPLQDVEMLSAHGRPVSGLTTYLQPGARLLILTGGAPTVHQLAEWLVEHKYSKSRFVVLECLEGASERITETSATEINNQTYSDFNLVAVECRIDPGHNHQPPIPGLADDNFENDGLLTRREIRCITIASLMPAPGRLLWDVGAGSGSVGIEWMRCGRNMNAIAFEKNSRRIETIRRNSERLGTPGMKIVPGLLPTTLENQAAPDAVFHGGAVYSDEIFDQCWTSLKPGGNFVANAVTLEGDAALIKRHSKYGGELIRLEISHSDQIGAWRSYRPQRPVTQWRVRKS